MGPGTPKQMVSGFCLVFYGSESLIYGSVQVVDAMAVPRCMRRSSLSLKVMLWIWSSAGSNMAPNTTSLHFDIYKIVRFEGSTFMPNFSGRWVGPVCVVLVVAIK